MMIEQFVMHSDLDVILIMEMRIIIRVHSHLLILETLDFVKLMDQGFVLYYGLVCCYVWIIISERCSGVDLKYDQIAIN